MTGHASCSAGGRLLPQEWLTRPIELRKPLQMRDFCETGSVQGPVQSAADTSRLLQRG